MGKFFFKQVPTAIGILYVEKPHKQQRKKYAA
jgi:hypothetical protein